ncbi:MAG: hypothetical protein MK486_18820 [Gemmatimonadetes bacterium]|jgi:hypothetical protein|nr:hypothetical protein [Gemmatimonadota bacterium]
MKETLLFSVPIPLVPLFLLVSCGGDVTGPPDPGNDPNFTIVAHSDAGFTSTNRKVEVLGVPIYAYANVEDVKLLHAANIMAQYLDNDEDGVVDNPALLSALISSNAALYMWKQEGQQGSINAQDLGADESVPAWHNNGHTSRFDAALEEIWHVITHSGFANAYPDAFGEDAGTSLTNAMDIARGGRFQSVPSPYPGGAWYTYDDQTCDYGCMATEYIYWAMTSVLGAQENRAGEIHQEWKLNTKAKVQQMDTAIYQLLTDPQYVFPIVLPDGTYRR